MPKVLVKDLDPRLQKQFQAAEQALRTNPGYAAELAQGLLQRTPECTEFRRLLRRAQRVLNNAAAGGGLTKLFSGVSSMATLVGGNSKLAQTDPKAAMDAAEKMIAKKYSDVAAHRLLATAAENSGLFDAAALAYEDIAEIEPKNIAHRVAVANAYLKDGDPVSALAAVDKALKAFPANGDLQDLARRASVAQTMDKGKWAESGDFRSKIKDAGEAARLEQSSRMVNDADSVAEAVARLRDQLEGDPENVNLCREIIRQYLSINDTETALAYVQYARSTPLGKADATLEKQESELALTLLGDKIKGLETALAADPANTQIRADLDAARAEEAERRLEVFRSLVDKYPNDYNYRFEYGVQLLAAGKLDDAVRELQLAQRSPKHRQIAMLNIGRAFSAGRKYDLASETLAAAKGEIAMFNDLKKDVIYELGLAYELGGREKEAIDEYKSIYMADAAYRDVAKKINDYYEKKH